MQERLDSDLSLEAPVEKNVKGIIQLIGEVCNPARSENMISILINETSTQIAFPRWIHAL
jgi:hypothetical protein